MAARCWRCGGVSRRRQHERRQPRAAMIIVSGDREELRAVTIERTRTLLAGAWPAIEAAIVNKVANLFSHLIGRL